MKILMVCLGNICRSPLAEGILQKKVDEHQLKWEVDSAGTGSWHAGEQADPRSIEVADQHGLDIRYQRSRQLTEADMDIFDLIFAMDASNYQNILKLATTAEQKAKVHMIMNMADEGQNEGVPDPYWGDDGFENVYQMLDRATDGIIEKYK